MDPEQEAAVFEAACQLSDPAQRKLWLERACEGNSKLRHRLEKMLSGMAEADRFFFEGSAARDAALLDVRASAEQSEDLIGAYKLIEKIGEGGCGVVYMAEQRQPVRRRVALKIIKLGMDTRNVVARFEAERQALAMMDHPNIARVLDAGASASGRPFFVMELVRGIKITEFCEQNGLPVRARLELFMAVCQAVQHAHQKGIIHRDLKPSNVLVTVNDPGGSGVPKVIDFGIAKAMAEPLTDKTVVTAFAQLLGTPAYMSPEQAAMTSVDIDTRADIYSLGVLLYELLTGQTPFDTQRLLRAGWDELRRTVCEQEPVPPSTRIAQEQTPARRGEVRRGALLTEGSAPVRASNKPAPGQERLVQELEGDLDAIVLKCLEKDRSRRYESAGALALDVDRHLRSVPILARAPTAIYRFQKLLKRRRVAVLSVGLVITAIVLGGLASAFEAVRAHRAELEQIRLRRRADGLAYAADMNLVYQSWQEGNLSRAHKLLDRYLPKPGEPDRRGFEWGYLRRLCRDESLQTFTNFDGGVSQTAFSLDGKLIAASNGGAIRLLDPLSHRELEDLRAPGEAVSGLAFVPGQTNELAAARVDGSLELWNWGTRALVARLPAQTSGPARLACSPDGTLLALCDHNHDLEVWHRDSCRLGWRTNTTVPPVALAFTPDGRMLVTGGGPEGNPRAWDVATGKELGGFPNGHNGWIDALALSPDGRLLATGGYDGALILWDIATRQMRPGPQSIGVPILALAFSPDGARLASGGEDGILRVHDGKTGAPRTLLRGHLEGISSVGFSPEGKLLFSSSGDGTVRIWPVNRGADPNRLDLAQGWLSYVAYSPDGRRLAVSPMGARGVEIWDTGTWRLITNLAGHADSITEACYSPDGKWLATSGHDRRVVLWDAITFQRREVLTNTFKINSFAFSPDSRFLAAAASFIVPAGADQRFALWDTATRRRVNRFGSLAKDTAGVAFSKDGQYLATGHLDGRVRLWDFAHERLVAEFSSHSDVAWRLAFSPDSALLGSGGDTGQIALYDVKGHRLLRTLERYPSRVWFLTFSPEGNTLASANSDSAVRLWSVETGDLALTLRGHSGAVVGLAFAPAGDLLVSCGADRAVLLWPSVPIRTETVHRR